jgi:site-specific DNA-methyltransferase (adenine-specific)
LYAAFNGLTGAVNALRVNQSYARTVIGFAKWVKINETRYIFGVDAYYDYAIQTETKLDSGDYISLEEYKAYLAQLSTLYSALIYDQTMLQGLVTRAQAIILKNENAKENSNIECEFETGKIERTQQSFYQLPKHVFNFWADTETNNVIEHIFSLPHKTLANNALWGLGIVTGNNRKACKPICEPGSVPIFRGQDIIPHGLKEPSLFISEDLSKCQQVAPLELYKAKEKLIYRFISNKLVFYCDTKQQYILNSANLLILNNDFPVSGQQLSDLFNSDFMNWIFTNIFHTHKILRSDLELLPIHVDFFIENNLFDEAKYLDYLNIEEKDGTYRVRS